jgi:nitric oxide reductase NorD protein
VIFPKKKETMIDLDEIIYHRLLKLVRKYKNKEDTETSEKRVILTNISGRLTIISRALTGKDVSIYPAKNIGGYRDLLFFLPEKFHRYERLELNLNYYIFRIFYLSVQCKTNHQYDVGNSHSEKESIAKSEEMSGQLLADLFNEYPNIKNIYNNLVFAEENIAKRNKTKIDTSFLFGKWMTSSKDFRQNIYSEENKNQKDNSDDKNEITTEIESNPVEEMETIAVNKKSQEDYVLTHNFEKVETADEFNGVWRSFDGDDDLSDHAEALSELDLKYTVRADEAVHSVYKADLAPNTNEIETVAAQSTDKHYYYDEWDYKTRTYRKDYCRVFYSKTSTQSNNFYQEVLAKKHKTISDLKRMFARVHNELEMVRRSPYGDDIDFDAAIDAYSDVHAKRTPDERLYIAKKRRCKDLSVLILVDTSLSADSYTEGKRILDIEKQALVCFGEALDEYDIEFQIDTFNSRTRNFCYYKNVKKFNEPWQKNVNKIGALQADSYTRIGPATRHAGRELENASGDKKWIILLTDGKASDYDKYEGRQGIEDIKKAINELSNIGIHSFALAVESKAKYYLPQMFGHRNFEVLPHVEHLPHALGEFYSRVIME